MARPLNLAALVIALVAFVTGAFALHRQDADSPTLVAARARWERLSPAEKEEMRERYEKYRALSESERRALAERGRALREERERMLGRLPEADRARLDKLPPEQRREVVRELFESEAREKGARIREKLPQAWLDRLEQAAPEERARLLNEFQRKARTRVALMAIDKIGARLELPAEEIARLKDLPELERAQAVLELRKRLSTREAAEFGLPEGITQAQWDEWQSLPPEQFFEVMQRYRLEQSWRHERREPPRDHAEGHDQARLAMTLADAMRPRPDEYVRLASLPKDERRKQLFAAARERVLAVLATEGVASPQRIAELRAMPERQLFDALQELAPMRHGFRGWRDGGDEGRGRHGSDPRTRAPGGNGQPECAPGEGQRPRRGDEPAPRKR